MFLGRGTGHLVTAWIPFGQVRVTDGALMVARGSHRSRAFADLRATYGASQAPYTHPPSSQTLNSKPPTSCPKPQTPNLQAAKPEDQILTPNP